MKDKITVRITPELAEAFNAFIEKSPEPIRSRQDGLRYILQDWLSDRGYLGLRAARPEAESPNPS